MNDEYSFNNIDSLLFQYALRTRQLTRKKNELNQQINVFRADIAERKTYIEMLPGNIKKHEEDIRVKQSTLIHNKSNVKRMKATNSVLHHYHQTLKEELENRKASYNHDMEVYEERITSYRKIFQTHKEYYCQNSLAQKLLQLLADKEDIESRIKACDNGITMKQKELDNLSGPVVDPPEELTDREQPSEEKRKKLDPHAEEDGDSAIDISSLHLHQTQNGQKITSDEDAKESHNDTTARSSPPEEASGPWSCHQLNEQIWQDGINTDEQDQEAGPVGQEQQTTESIEEAVEREKMEEVVAVEVEEASCKNDEGLTDSPQSSPREMNTQSSPVKVKAMASPQTFSFNFSSGGSPHRGAGDTRSPAFPFSINSDPSTPSFSGFGFDVGSSQDEDSSFVFTDSFFNDKKTTDAKSSSCTEFLFGQQEQSEEFKFPFTSKSPQTTKKDNTGRDFPFSLLNF